MTTRYHFVSGKDDFYYFYNYKPTIRHTTFLFRNGEDNFNWPALAQYIVQKYRNTDKVNIYNYACSDGSEPYSLAIMLSKYSDDTDKFFPIIAKDTVKEVMEPAKSGTIYLEEDDLKKLHDYTAEDVSKYFTQVKGYKKTNGNRILHVDPGDAMQFQINDNLKKCVEFECADIMNDYKNIKPDNSIVLCRNMWNYLNYDSDRMELAKNLYNRLRKNSIVILGYYDGTIHYEARERGGKLTAEECMQRAGFKRCEVPGLQQVWEKPEQVFEKLKRKSFISRLFK